MEGKRVQLREIFHCLAITQSEMYIMPWVVCLLLALWWSGGQWCIIWVGSYRYVLHTLTIKSILHMTLRWSKFKHFLTHCIIFQTMLVLCTLAYCINRFAGMVLFPVYNNWFLISHFRNINYVNLHV